MISQRKKNKVASVDLDDSDIAWVKAHAAAVTETFGREFEAAKEVRGTLSMSLFGRSPFYATL